MVKGTLLRLLCALLFLNGWGVQAQNETILQKKKLLVSIAKQIDEKNPEAAQLLIDEALELKSSDNDLFAVKLNYYQAEILIFNEKDEEAQKSEEKSEGRIIEGSATTESQQKTSVGDEEKS